MKDFSLTMINMELTNKQYKTAAIFYGKHKDHVDKLIINIKNPYPPTLAEDKNNPALWKANHWKWFLITHLNENK